MSLGRLITLIVPTATISLLFTAPYPKPTYDFALDMNRWVPPALAHALLMTHRYPPFRPDTGGEQPAPQRHPATPPPPAASPSPS